MAICSRRIGRSRAQSYVAKSDELRRRKEGRQAEPTAVAIEKHYTGQELAELLGLDYETVLAHGPDR